MNNYNRQLQKYAQRQLSKSPWWVTLIVLVLAVGAYFVYDYMNRPEIPDGQLSVHFIDVGQGDCELLVTAEGTVLIDSGTTESQYELSEYLQKTVTQIDYFVLTHPHEDHIGGAAQVIRDIPVKNIIMPDAVSDSAAFERLLDAMEEKSISGIMAEAGAEYELGGLRMKLLSPISEEYDDTNNYSIVLRADYGEDSFLFTGDAETLVENELLDTYHVSALDCDVLKVGHHGSNTSSSVKFLEAVTPDIAVIEVGRDNDYGHPKEKILNRLEDCGAQILRTDLEGTIILTSEGQGITVED